MTPAAPPRWRLRAWFRWKSERIRDAHTERAFRGVARFVGDGTRVLDVGAWDGRLGRLYRDRKGCDVVLADVDDVNVTDLPFRRIEGTTLPVGLGERFDVVQLLYVLHHAADDLAVLREARRAVAPGGRVLVAEDQVETPGQRVVTVAFHLWLLAFTFMGWKGRFRRLDAWRARFAEADLAVDEVVPLGTAGALWPRNVLFVLRPA